MSISVYLALLVLPIVNLYTVPTPDPSQFGVGTALQPIHWADEDLENETSEAHKPLPAPVFDRTQHNGAALTQQRIPIFKSLTCPVALMILQRSRQVIPSYAAVSLIQQFESNPDDHVYEFSHIRLNQRGVLRLLGNDPAPQKAWLSDEVMNY
jgi:hypothetical protein